MKKKVQNLFTVAALLIAALLTFSSCSKRSEISELIPEDARVVLTIDMQSMGAKGKLHELEKLSAINFLKEELNSEDPKIAEFLEKVMKDPKLSGIDFGQQAFFYLSFKDDISGALLLSLKDKSKFENFLDEIYTIAGEPFNKIEKDKNTLSPIDENLSIAWNSSFAMIAAYETTLSTDEMVAQTSKMMNKEQITPLINNKNFLSFTEKKKDFGMWLDYAIYEEMEEFSSYSDMLAGLNFEGCYTEMCCYFENDEIKTKATMHLTDEIKEVYKKMTDGHSKFNTELSDILPEKTLLSGSANMNLSECLNYISGYMNEVLHEVGIEDQDITEIQSTLKEIGILVKELGGSVIFNISDIENSGIPLPLTTIAFDIKDKSTTPKDYLADLSIKHGKFIKELNTHYEIDFQGFKVYVIIDEKMGVITTDFSIINNIITDSKPKNNLTHSVVGAKIKKHTNYFFLDINLDHYPTWLISLIEFAPGWASIKSFAQYYDYVEFIQISETESEMILKMRNTEHNSLYTFLLSLNEAAAVVLR